MKLSPGKAVYGVANAAMAAALLAVATTADAQYVEHWKFGSDAKTYLASGETRGLAYNAATDKVRPPTNAF